jgi:hypothetical protein
MYQGGSSAGGGASRVRLAYRLSETNHCPDCGQAQWFVGRLSAECAFCQTALPISGVHLLASGVTRTSPGRLLLAA